MAYMNSSLNTVLDQQPWHKPGFRTVMFHMR